MSKSRFDKGSTLGNGRWDEEEHPRDKDGRFARSDGGTQTAKTKDLSKMNKYDRAEALVNDIKSWCPGVKAWGSEIIVKDSRDVPDVMKAAKNRNVKLREVSRSGRSATLAFA